MLEKTKDIYWLCEKSIMYWGYSQDHQHLGVPLTVQKMSLDKLGLVIPAGPLLNLLVRHKTFNF